MEIGTEEVSTQHATHGQLGFAESPRASTKIAHHIQILFAKLAFPEAGRNLVLSALADGPVRKPQARRGNVISRFPSVKMGCSFLLESRKGELPRAYLFENDGDVLGYVAQPETADFILRDLDGKVRGRQPYTPDFLVIRKDRFQIVESRDEAQLIADSIRSDQYYRDPDGTWHFRAAEEHYRALGFEYLLLSNSQVPAVLVMNMRFLEDYLKPDLPPTEPEVRQRLVEVVRGLRFVPLFALIHDHEFAADAIFQAIVTRDLYVDLQADRLDVGSDLVIFADRTMCEVHRIARRAELEPVLPVPGVAHVRSGTTIEFDGQKFTVVLCGERDVSIRDEDGHVRAIPLASLQQLHSLKPLETSGGTEKDQSASRKLAAYSPEDVKRALKRFEALRKHDTSAFGERSLQRFARETALATDELDALLRLMDDNSNRGNRQQRLPLATEELAEKAIRDRFNQPEKCSKTAAYATYLTYCEKTSAEGKPVRPMSYQTFCKRCDEFKDIRSREGKRAAYQKRPIPQFLDQVFPVHGTYPHEVCYIDHTIATIATVSPDGVDLGKPTLTLGIDGHTTHPRTFLVSYDPPSAKTVLMLLRDYVRRHQRLPRVIVVDNGKEFHSKELEQFCRIYGIEIRYRPPGMPRGGAMVERGLGAIEEEVFGQIEGNTRQMRDPRLVTKSINPFGRAIWTLTAVWGAIEDYLFKVRPTRIHPALGMTPDQFEAKRLQETGLREHTFIRFDENIMLMTCPHAKRPFHKVDRRRGVWVDGMYHWHPVLADVRKGVRVEVRLEPWIANVVYVFVGKTWVAAIARNLRPYAGRTRRSVEVALREEQRVSKLTANRDLRSAKQLKAKERLWAPETFDSRMEAQQKEMAYLFERLGMAEALPAQLDPVVRQPFQLAGATNADQTQVSGNAQAMAATPVKQDACSPPYADVRQEDGAGEAETVESDLLEAIDGLL